MRRKRCRCPCAFAVHGPSFPAAALVDSFSEFPLRRIASANFVRANHAICTHVCTVNKIRIRMADFSARRCATTRDAGTRCAIAAMVRRATTAMRWCAAAMAQRRACGDGVALRGGFGGDVARRDGGAALRRAGARALHGACDAVRPGGGGRARRVVEVMPHCFAAAMPRRVAVTIPRCAAEMVPRCAAVTTPRRFAVTRWLSVATSSRREDGRGAASRRAARPAGRSANANGRRGEPAAVAGGGDAEKLNASPLQRADIGGTTRCSGPV